MPKTISNKCKLKRGDEVTVTISKYNKKGEPITETYDGTFLHQYTDGTCCIQPLNDVERKREAIGNVSLKVPPKEKGRFWKWLGENWPNIASTAISILGMKKQMQKR